MSGESVAEDVSTAKIADNTEGFSGSDLRQLCTAAAMCGIRELMEATSKSSKDTAAAKKVRRTAKHGAVSDSRTVQGAAADAAGPSRQHDRQPGNGKTEDGASVSGADQQSQPAETAAASTSASAADADEPSVSISGAAAEGAKQQTKQGVGNKRDIEEDSSSSGIIKRLKASPDSLEVTDKTGTQSSSAPGVEAEQTVDAGTSKSAAASTSGPSAGSTATSQQRQNQQHADVSTQNNSQPVDWLLAKYREMAAAADQQVHKTCNTGFYM